MAIREIFIIFAAMNTMKSLSLLLFALTAATCAQATGKDSLNAGCLAVQPLPVERLADLHIPRTGHVVFCVNGEVTVAGGHTSGFVPTATAEYYKDGEWHLLNTVYAHDQGLFFPMNSGNIVIAGGFDQPLGINQTFTMERYDPVTHTFTGFGCLEKKRCMAEAVELDSGKVVITGNWYTDDVVECYDGSPQCHYVKEVSMERCYPYVFRTGKDDAIIFGPRDTHGSYYDSIVVDCLKGESFRVPLFDTWRPAAIPLPFHSDICFVGDTLKGDYSYLFPVEDNRRQWAVAQFRGGKHFSLLPTTCPIPMKSQWDSIYYDRGIIADRERGRAYLLGYGMPTSRFYVVSLDYTHPDAVGRVPLTLFYTDPMPEVGFPMPVLTAEGDMMLVGGSLDSNYVTYASVLLLRLGGHADKPQRVVTSWLWMTLLLIVLLCVALTIYLWRRRRKAVENDAEMPDSIGRLPSDAALIQRICQYMDEQKPYLNAELKVADVAKALGTNSTYVSRSVNVMKGCTFSQFVNGYRINHAMQLIRQQPDIKITTVSAASGFATETSFFRCFKAQTGMTPKEWIAKSTYNT